MVLAVDCLFPWYWLADLGAQEGLPLVLGHALYLQAIQGGQTTNAKSDSQNIAVLLRGGLLPPAYGSPAALLGDPRPAPAADALDAPTRGVARAHPKDHESV